MSFLNPALLTLASAVAVPILIHLLNRRRFRRVPWAAMRFLRISIEKNRRRMQVEDLILLALRCLLLAVFALALARPALRSMGGFLETGRAAAVLILDHSASLTASDGTQSRFDRARAAVEAAVESYPPGSTLALLAAGDRVEDLVGDPTPDLNLIRRALRDATPSDLGTDHAAGIARAAELLSDQTALRKEIVLVTDRQAWGWRRLPDLAATLATSARDARLRIVLVDQPLDDNLAVAALDRSPGFVSVREPTRFHATIVNRGAQPVRQVRATLHVDSGPALDEATLDELRPGESRPLTFFARFPTAGFHGVSVRLSDDRLPADDERHRVVRTVETVKVLIVDGDPESNAAFFLRHALQPVPPDARAQYFLQPRVIPGGQMALTRLTDYDAVLLADPAPVPAPAVDALAAYVRGGGTLLVFPGPKAQASFYNDELLRRAELLPAGLAGLRGQPESDEATFHLAPGPYDHPLFALWNDAAAGSLTAVRFRAAWALQSSTNAAAASTAPATNATNATNAAPTGQVMIRYADGSPAAMERRVGRGRVLLFSSTAGTAWNDLAVRPVYVPLLFRAVATLTDTEDTRFNLRTGAGVNLRLPPEYGGREVVITSPGKPERRVNRTLRSETEGAVLEFDLTRRSGVHRVQLPGESEVIAAFATQLDPTESDLTDLTPAQIDDLRRIAQVVEWVPGLDLRAAFDRERVGVELWLPLMFGVIGLALTETWLAQKFSRSK